MAGRFRDLTPPAVKKLKPGAEIREHGIVVTKLLGDERWKLEFRYMGERVHRIQGLTSEGWTRTLCEERLNEIKAEIRSGTHSLPAGRKTPIRIREISNWYLEEMESAGGRNLARKKFHVRERIGPKLGSIAVDKLNEGHLGRYTHDRLSEGAKPATVNRELATLSHILRTGARRGRLSRLPCSIAKLNEELKPRTPLSDSDLANLMQAARADSDPHIWLFVVFAMDTSMRQSEISRARFCDVQWEKRRLILWHAKAGRRYQPLSGELVEVLREERDARPEEERDGWIFPARTASGHVNQFNTRFRRVVKAAGLSPDDVTPHLMRHTAITRLAERGIGPATIQKISGHKTLAMVMRYTHISDPAVDEAMDLLQQANRARYTGMPQDVDEQHAA